MSRLIHCVYLDREAEGLARPPLPGPLGQRIYNEISREAWQKWLAHQTTLINEKRLSPINREHRSYLEAQAEAFLFGTGGVDRAEGFVPPAE